MNMVTNDIIWSFYFLLYPFSQFESVKKQDTNVKEY